MAAAISRWPQALRYRGSAFIERVSDRTLPVIQVAPRTLQDSLFALNFQGEQSWSFSFYIERENKHYGTH